MPPLRCESKVVAILCSDLHLSHKRPACRTDDWYAVMQRQLLELDIVWRYFDKKPKIVIAGDIFDRWNSPPELVNLALQYFPKSKSNPPICIPGNHDLPLHSSEQISKSAYWTLVQSERIHHLATPLYSNNLETMFLPFPYGKKVTKLEKEADVLHVAVVHDYIWTEGSGFPGAPGEQFYLHNYGTLGTYDVCVFGDNHKGFLFEDKNFSLFNCGAFMVRSAEQVMYNPWIGLLHRSGKITPYQLDVRGDHLITKDGLDAVVTESLEEITQFVADVEQLNGDKSLSFDGAVERALRSQKLSREIKDLVLQAVNG